jgi:hypothetical protein
LPCDRKRKLEFNIIESINNEILIVDKKWLISGVYRPQTIDEKSFNEDFIKTCDQITTAYDNFMFIGKIVNITNTTIKICYIHAIVWHIG